MTTGRPALFALLMLAACGPRSRASREAPAPAKDASPPPESKTASPRALVIDATDPRASCVFGYRGPVIDVGSPSEAAHLGAKLALPAVEWVEREGSTWAAIRDKSLGVGFFVVPSADAAGEAPAGATPFIEARVRGGAARTVSFYLNGHAIGAATVTRGETKVVSLKGAAAQPTPGENELVLRFSGIARGVADPSAYVEWVHFGLGDPDPLYAAPTPKDVVVSSAVGGVPGRALALRGPGFARCEGWIPSGSVVETRASLEGKGAADVQVRVLRDRVPPAVIGTLHLESSDEPPARAQSWPVGDFGAQGTLGAIELSVIRATAGARVLFGEPRVLAPPPSSAVSSPRTAARGVVVVVMSQLGAHSLALYGGALPAPSLARFGGTAAVFDAARASSGVANATVGSMIAGLSARDLGVTDGDSRLPRAVTTIADAAREAGIPSAFFTADPLTSAPFGFDRGWSRFESHPPTEEGSETKVWDSATAWLDDNHEGRFLLVVHARGGHPPWDVSLERAKALPPENYTGGIDPKHAGELLARSLRSAGGGREGDADRERAGALYGAAMEDEDAALGRLLHALESRGLDATTTVIVTSDVGVDEAARVPYAESDSIDEAALSVPLLVRWGHEGPRGTRVAAAASDEDIGATVLGAFGLPLPVGFRGRDLRSLADDGAASSTRPLLAVDQDRFALRWGPFVTTGNKGREGRLCDLSLEPACVTDVRESYPLASRLLHAQLWADLVHARAPFPREPASLDPATLAALRAWGR